MTTTIAVEGMSCDGCERTVEDALASVSGAEAATADSEAGRATVEGDVDPSSLVAAVEEAGYEASP